MLTILVTGSDGQLGTEFRTASSRYPYYNFIFTDISELDITSARDVGQFFEENNIDIVINCAAYTAVDKAEEEHAKAMMVNYEAVVNLVKACKTYETFMVQISTDYVFDGKSQKPYLEDDPPNPVSYYGKSKREGEDAVLTCLDKSLVIRTSWLYSSFGSNFVKTILKKAAEKGKLDVVNDQVGCPTYARDLAVAILDILPQALSAKQSEIYHYANEGICSWYDLATAAVELAKISCEINPISSNQYPQKAPRPSCSVLDINKIKNTFGIKIPKWKDSLRDCLEALG